MATKSNIDADKRCKSCTTKCLKRHCSCFAAGYYCDKACSCKECLNRPENQDRVEAARKNVLLQNPNAFSTKEVRARPMPSVEKFKVGCQCRMYKCVIDRCKCYKAKVGCQDQCLCVGCDNIHGKRGGNSGKMIETSTRENSDLDFPTLEQLENVDDSDLPTFEQLENLDFSTVEELENLFPHQDFNARDDDGKL